MSKYEKNNTEPTVSLRDNPFDDAGMERYRTMMEQGKKDILSLASKTRLAGAPESYTKADNYTWQAGNLVYTGPGNAFTL